MTARPIRPISAVGEAMVEDGGGVGNIRVG